MQAIALIKAAGFGHRKCFSMMVAAAADVNSADTVCCFKLIDRCVLHDNCTRIALRFLHYRPLLL